MMQAIFEVLFTDEKAILVAVNVSEERLKLMDGDADAKFIQCHSPLQGIKKITYKGLVERIVSDCRDVYEAGNMVRVAMSLRGGAQ
jgi:hypothetical protein